MGNVESSFEHRDQVIEQLQVKSAIVRDARLAEYEARRANIQITQHGDAASDHVKSSAPLLSPAESSNGPERDIDRAAADGYGDAQDAHTLRQSVKQPTQKARSAIINSNKSTFPAVTANSKSATTASSSGVSSPGQCPAKPSQNAAAKRSSTAAFIDERRLNSRIHKVPKTNGDASAGQSSSRDPHKGSKTIEPPRTAIERPPAWYLNMKAEKKRNPAEGGTSTLIAGLKNNIVRCRDSGQIQAPFDQIRDQLHKLAFQTVTAQIVKNNRLLDDAYGLPQIFDPRFSGGVNFPWDVRADANELYNKYCRQIFETDLLRGIVRGKPRSKKGEGSADSLDERYPRQSAKYHGNGLLLNGQWWPTQLATVRDGAHGATIQGISGAEGQGAYSCIMSGGLDPKGQPYPDEDRGDVVLYCGTDSSNGNPTEPTKRMLESEQNKQPVRLIRSHNCHSIFKPKMGFRYDGLCQVMSHELLDPPGSIRQRHRFRIERVPGQDPIRGGEGPEARPTREEMEAYWKDKINRGFTKNL